MEKSRSFQLLICMAALNPSNSFASFDAKKILKLATYYPKDFSSSDLRRNSTWHIY